MNNTYERFQPIFWSRLTSLSLPWRLR